MPLDEVNKGSQLTATQYSIDLKVKGPRVSVEYKDASYRGHWVCCCTESTSGLVYRERNHDVSRVNITESPDSRD